MFTGTNVGDLEPRKEENKGYLELRQRFRKHQMSAVATPANGDFNGYEWSRWEVMGNCKSAEEHFQGQGSESVDLPLSRTKTETLGCF